MAAQATHDLAIKTGEYQSNGETKGRWLKIGTVFRHDDGNTSIKLDAVPVGLPEWNGWVSVFKRENQNGAGIQHQGGDQYRGNAQHQPSRGNGTGHGGNGQSLPGNFDDFDDDIPF